MIEYGLCFLLGMVIGGYAGMYIGQTYRGDE